MIRRWIARLLGIKRSTGMTIYIPKHATLTIKDGARVEIETVNVVGGTLNMPQHLGEQMCRVDKPSSSEWPEVVANTATIEITGS